MPLEEGLGCYMYLNETGCVSFTAVYELLDDKSLGLREKVILNVPKHNQEHEQLEPTSRLFRR